MEKLYYVNLGSYCTLVVATSLKGARKIALRENGTNNVCDVHLATEEEIGGIKSMGGFVPKIEVES